jgi:hypothetical protein
LTSRGSVDPVPDPLLLRKSGSAGDRTRDLCICSQKLWPLDHRGGRVHWQGSLNLYLITFWSYAHFVLLKSFHTPLLSSQSTASEILGSINHINEGAKSHCRSKATGNIPARASYTSLLVLIRALYLLHIQIRKFHRPKKPWPCWAWLVDIWKVKQGSPHESDTFTYSRLNYISIHIC